MGLSLARLQRMGLSVVVAVVISALRLFNLCRQFGSAMGWDGVVFYDPVFWRRLLALHSWFLSGDKLLLLGSAEQLAQGDQFRRGWRPAKRRV